MLINCNCNFMLINRRGHDWVTLYELDKTLDKTSAYFISRWVTPSGKARKPRFFTCFFGLK